MEELDNYKREKLTIDIIWANIFGVIILIPIVLVFGLPYYLRWHTEIDFKAFLDELSFPDFAIGGLSVFVAMILGIVMHELIHGITWALFAKNGFKSIKFGILWKLLTPYCHCNESLNVKQYIIGAITPAIFLGFIPSIIAILIGNVWMLMFGMIFTMSACGDFLTINLIRKEKWDDLVQDHPSEAGCYIYKKIE
jgi:hypothetical protein